MSKKPWKDAPSPCIDVCKYPGKGFCKGCGMLKSEKKRFKRLSGKKQRAPFLSELMHRLAASDDKRLKRWELVYRRKCNKRNVPCPLDMIDHRPLNEKR